MNAMTRKFYEALDAACHKAIEEGYEYVFYERGKPLRVVTHADMSSSFTFAFYMDHKLPPKGTEWVVYNVGEYRRKIQAAPIDA